MTECYVALRSIEESYNNLPFYQSKTENLKVAFIAFMTIATLVGGAAAYGLIMGNTVWFEAGSAISLPAIVATLVTGVALFVYYIKKRKAESKVQVEHLLTAIKTEPDIQEVINFLYKLDQKTLSTIILKIATEEDNLRLDIMPVIVALPPKKLVASLLRLKKEFIIALLSQMSPNQKEAFLKELATALDQITFPFCYYEKVSWEVMDNKNRPYFDPRYDLTQVKMRYDLYQQIFVHFGGMESQEALSCFCDENKGFLICREINGKMNDLFAIFTQINEFKPSFTPPGNIYDRLCTLFVTFKRQWISAHSTEIEEARIKAFISEKTKDNPSYEYPELVIET